MKKVYFFNDLLSVTFDEDRIESFLDFSDEDYFRINKHFTANLMDIMEQWIFQTYDEENYTDTERRFLLLINIQDITKDLREELSLRGYTFSD